MRAPLLLFSLAAMLLAGCLPGEPEEACVSYTEGIHPLLVGDTARVETGWMRESDCIPDRDRPFAWRTADTAVVEVTPQGLVRGRAPGIFRLAGTRDTTTLTEEGFVLPAGWTLRIEPADTTIRVGQVAEFRVIAAAADGRPLPVVPFSLYTPEFDRPDSGAERLVDMYSHQHITAGGRFRAMRPGRTIITGEIGGRRVPARLTILP